MSDEDLEEQLPGYGLKHSLTNGEQVPDIIDIVLANNGAMVSSVEKIRVGLKPGGMSPKDDMETGGATHFLTRIKKVPKKDCLEDVGLCFKKRLLRLSDAVSYNHDPYGRVRDNYVSENRGSTVDDWKQFSRNTAHETILQYSVRPLDNIDVIVVNNAGEKEKVLISFGQYGIETGGMPSLTTTFKLNGCAQVGESHCDPDARGR